MPGGPTTPGWTYHNIPGINGPSHRNDTSERVAHIVAHFNPRGLTGVDLGCAVGGISLGLCHHGATMRGYDYDPAAIAVAREARDRLNDDATFTVADLTDQATWDEVFDSGADFAVWLSSWMWLARAAGEVTARRRLAELSDHVDTIIFDTAEGGVSMAGSAGLTDADDVQQMLEETTGLTVANIGPAPGDRWHQRSIFICSKEP